MLVGALSLGVLAQRLLAVAELDQLLGVLLRQAGEVVQRLGVAAQAEVRLDRLAADGGVVRPVAQDLLVEVDDGVDLLRRGGPLAQPLGQFGPDGDVGGAQLQVLGGEANGLGAVAVVAVCAGLAQ